MLREGIGAMTRERKECLDRCLDWEIGEKETQKWRDDLSEEEQAYVDAEERRLYGRAG